MIDLHSVVCVKVTPKSEEIRVDAETLMLDRENARSEINPPDMNALEMALSIKDKHRGRISILSMGPPLFEPHLRVALAMGADHVYLLSDRAFGGADTLATTYTLAAGIKKLGGAHLIFCGEESSDGATGQVPAGLAEWLDLPFLSLAGTAALDLSAGNIRGRRDIDGGYEILEAPIPCVISVKTAANEPRFMDYGLRQSANAQDLVTVWASSDLDVSPEHIGLAGSPTIVTGLAESPTRDRKRQNLEGNPEEIALQLVGILESYL